jgi:HEPN domain-containing protein
MPPLPDRVRHEFAALALGYYASGRLAFRARAGPLAAAHILHHAVEFVLKATLARHTTLADMKKFGHRLPDLFASAEARSGELRSDEHRATAALLHEWWESRFPDRILAEAATLSFTSLELARIDRLFCAGFRAAGLTPAAFTERLGPDALQAIRADNPEQAFIG